MEQKQSPKINIAAAASSQTISRGQLVQIIFLAIAVFVVFSGTLRNGFIWDDDDYIYQNPLMTAPDGLSKIWNSFYTPNFDPEQNTPQYYPLVFSTFYLEHKLWGFNPAGYHTVNLLLHIANTILLLFVLRKLGLNWYVSLITAALFGLHPTQVESVAWATELKNVMAGLFYFSAFLCFLNFQDNTKIRYYVLSLVFFIFAILSKTAVLTLPLALILAAYLRAKPLRKTVFQLIPFFALTLAAGLVTSFRERSIGTEGADWSFPIAQRILIASHSLWFYIGKILWPHPISFIYGRWEIDPRSITAYLPLAAAVIAVFTIYIFRKKLGRLPIFALAYFAVSMAPALGFISFYMMRYTFAADHFLYFASWSITLLAVAGAAHFIDRIQKQPMKTTVAVILSAAVLFSCAALTFSETKKYKDEQTLWQQTIKTCPKSWLPYNNLASIYTKQKKYAQALEYYKKTVELRPDYVCYNNMGTMEVFLNHPENAISYYKKSLELNPDYAEAIYNLALAYYTLGDFEKAKPCFRDAKNHGLETPDNIRQKLYNQPSK